VTAAEGSWSDGFTQIVGTLIPGEGVALEENFDLAGIPATWTIVDGGATTDTWYADSAQDPGGCSNTDPNSPIDGTWAAVDSDCAGTVNMDETLISPLLDLSLAQTVRLEFDHYLNHLGPETADVDVRSSNTAGVWINVGRWTADTPNPEHEDIDVTGQAAGAADVEIRWHYYNANFEWYWYVDNVRVSYTAPADCETYPCGSSSAPGEQSGARWLDRGTYTWDADPLAIGGYKVYRGTMAGLPRLADSTPDSCVRFTSDDATDNVANFTGDNPVAVPGRLYWYRVTGINTAGEGTPGESTSGPRIVNVTGFCFF